MMPNCPVRAQWTKFLEDRVSPAEQHELEAHAQGCLACQRLLEELTQPASIATALTLQALHNGSSLPRASPVLEEDYRDYLAQLLCDRPSPLNGRSEPGQPARPRPVVTGYEILEELGRGGMGVVFKARQVGLNRLVALKMVLGGAAVNVEHVARFRREAEAVAQLQHPHIVQIHDIGTLEGQPYFAMEYVPGGSLDRQLQGQPQPPRDAAALVRTLAEAMQAAHERGIIHRDLKPGNILLQVSNEECRKKNDIEATNSFDIQHSSFGMPKITDFGLAKRLSDDHGCTKTGDIVGTPSYMAPEQAAGTPPRSPPWQGGAGGVGPAADIYALGAILYELLTGRPPFKGLTPMETVLQVIAEEALPPHRLMPTLPRDLETICLKCLHKEPARRYPTAVALAEDLQRFLEGRPIQARPVGRLERTWRWCRRNPLLASLAGLLLLAGLGLVVGFLLLWRSYGQLALAQHQTKQALTAEAKRRKQARDALDAMTGKVMEDLLARQPQLKEDDKVFLRQAIARYRELATDVGDDPASQAEVALAHLRVADMLSRLGEDAEAQHTYHQAIRQYEQVLRVAPQDAMSRKFLAGAYHNLGALLRVHHKAASRAALERCHALRRQLAADHPDRPDFAADLAFSHHALSAADVSASDGRRAQEHLDQALRLFRAVCRERSPHPEWRYGLSLALQSMAEFHAAHQDLAKARELYAEADLEAAALVREHPYLIYRENHVLGLWNHGRVLRKLEHTQAAQTKWEEANRTAERLARDFPTMLAFREIWAGVLLDLGMLYAQQGDAVRCIECLEQAQGLFLRCVAEAPTSDQHRTYLFNTYMHLGQARQQRQEWTAARQAYQAAERLQRQCVTNNPTDTMGLVSLGEACRRLGDVAWKTGQRDQALEWYGQAIMWYDKARQRESSLASPRLCLFTAYVERAQMLMELRRYREAMADWNQAGQFYSESRPLQPNEQLARALTLVHAGDLDWAVDEVEAMARFTGQNNEVHFALARIWAVAARRTATSSSRREAYLAHALKHLREAQGLFGTQAGQERLRTEPDFSPLHGQPAFQKYLRELQSQP